VRIAVVNETPHLVGGAEAYLDGVLPMLAARGHALALCTGTGRLVEQPVTGAGSLDAEFAIRGDLAGFVRDVQGWKPDVVFLHGLDDPDSEQACRALAPTAYFAHTYHGTCISGSKCFQFPAPAPCDRVLGAGCLVRYFPRRCGGLNPVTMVRLYGIQQRRRRLAQSSQAVLTLSEHMRAEFIRHGVDDARVTVLPKWPPAPTEFAQDRPAGPPWRLLFLSRLEPVKGGALVIEALREIAGALGSPVTLTVAGDGPERPRLERLARKVTRRSRGMVNVEFVGRVASPGRTELLAKAHLLVVPSVWPEPFGLVGLEAGLAGVPAVAFAVGGIPEWLRHEVTGHLVTGRPDSFAFAEAVTRVLSDPAYYGRLAEGAAAAATALDRTAHLARLEATFATIAGHAA
jgi:glycosyltransferase involved in cell wall biosynthesis